MQGRLDRFATLGLAVALLAPTGLGCATQSAAERQHATRKAASHVAVGADHLANGRPALALREFRLAERLDPENPRPHYALGGAYLAQGKLEDGERHLRRSLELYPDHHDARQSLAALLIKTARYEEAIRECDRLVDDPTYTSPWVALTNRASAEFMLGRLDEARDTLALALDYRDRYWPAVLTLAGIESKLGRRLEAIRLYREVIALDPGPGVESEVNYRLAEVHVSLGQRQQAVGHLTASVARDPGSRWAKQSQEYLKRLHP